MNRLCVRVAGGGGLILAIAAGLRLGQPAQAEPAGAALAASDAARTARPAATASAADRQIAQAQERLQRLPGRPDPYTELASAFMNKARETADGSYYARAEAAAHKALALDPASYPALRAMAWIYGGQHRFREARAAAERALALDARDPFNYGTLGDALIELGEYDAAADAVQKMIDLHPDVGSYSRAAYLRELYGDTEGALALMQMAVNAVSGREHEQLAWCRTQLAHLLAGAGRWSEAEQQYGLALEAYPAYLHALTGLGRVWTAQQKSDAAVDAYRRSLQVAPTLEAAIELGDLLAALGRAGEAEQQYALLGVIEKVNRANGVRPDSQMALFYADHQRNLPEALALAQERAEQQPTLAAMDALAWALYRSERYAEAQAASRAALRLGTQDARFHYHAGMIAARLGDTQEAVADLGRALAINPRFHVTQADEALRTWAELSQRTAGRS